MALKEINQRCPMQENKRDHLWLHLKDLPYFRAFLRAVEARFYDNIPLSSPVLDLGCGDGHFASVAFQQSIEVGLDPWWGPLSEAARTGAYDWVLQGMGAEMPFPAGKFNTVISNSVLEHIEEIDAVLVEVNRVLSKGGLFVFCVPNDRFTQELSLSKLLDRIGLKGPAGRYRKWFNRISRHQHCDPPSIWLDRLSQSGFEVERHWHYFTPRSLAVLEWGHYFGLPSLITKKVFGKWILFPKRWNLGWLDSRLRVLYDDERETQDGCYTFYIARKMETLPEENH